MRIIKSMFKESLIREPRNEKVFVLNGFRVWAKNHKEAVLKLNQYTNAFGNQIMIKKESE